MTPYWSDDAVTLHHGDCLDVMRELPDASVDSVVTDPPYGLEFMGKDWDRFGVGKQPKIGQSDGSKFRQNMGTPSFTDNGNPTCRNCKGDKYRNGPRKCACSAPNFGNPQAESMRGFQQWCEQWATECLRVLKPGGHLLAFGGTRTWHRLAVAVEDAGFEIRDSIAWLYGSGFSKGGLLGNKTGFEWCTCRENTVPLDHASNTDLRRLRSAIHETPVARSESEDPFMFPAMQRETPGSGVGEARLQGSRELEAGVGGCAEGTDDWGDEPGVARRLLHRAGEGLPDDPSARPSASKDERLRRRAPIGDGAGDRAAGSASRGGSPCEPGSGGQPAGEPGAVPGSHEPLDDGALRGRASCPRCGGVPTALRGFSTSLKPAFEPCVVARKPLIGTVAANVTTHGTGALNIDGCRVDASSHPVTSAGGKQRTSLGYHGGTTADGSFATEAHPAGRWPANVVLDETQAAELDRQSGVSASSASRDERGTGGIWRKGNGIPCGPQYGDSGGASRFFPTFRYEAKAPTEERPRVDGVSHPTVKPLDLMRWLVRLVTPPGGTVLEPFAGSGTTAEACVHEHLRCIAIEREAEYLPLIIARLTKPMEIGFDFGDAV